MSSKGEKRENSGNENKKNREYNKTVKMSRKLEDVFRTQNREAADIPEENIEESERPDAEENDDIFEGEASGIDNVAVKESDVIVEPQETEIENVDVLTKGLLDLTEEFPSDPIYWGK